MSTSDDTGVPSGAWIALFGLGGTIASTREPSGGAVPSRDIGALLHSAGGRPAAYTVRSRQLSQLASSELTIPDIVSLAGEIRRALESGAQGAVVAQGTDTIEETAFGLDVLLADRTEPIIVTGAMRHLDAPGSDAAANLAGALDVASSPEAVDQGVLVVLDDEVHSAAFVRKAHTSSTAAFRSSPIGPVGWIVERRARLPVVRRGPRLRVTLPPMVKVPRVALVTVTLGDDGSLIETISAPDYAGCVVQTMGGGHVPGALVPRLGSLSEQMPVVMTSRTGAGSMLETTYAFAGSERELRDRGVIPAGYLPSSKAHVLLSLLLAAGAGREEIAAAFPS